MSLYDTDIFVNSDIGVDAVYTDANSAQSDVRVIFNEPYALSDLGGGPGYQNENPTAIVALTDFPSAAINEALEVNDVTYKIIGIDKFPDGNMLTLVLSADAVEKS